MKNLQEKLAKLSEFLVLDVELKKELELIIQDTYDYHCDGIEGYDFSEDGKSIACHYSYTCRGEYDTDCCVIPVRWLEDGYDYKAEFEEMKRKNEEALKRREEEEKKKEQARKEKAEYETYLKLKEKYGKVPENHITSVWMEQDPNAPKPQIIDLETGKELNSTTQRLKTVESEG